MKVLVTAASKHGATAEIGATIGEVLGGEQGLDATVVPPEEVAAVDGYDAVVLGSAVYAGHWMAAAKELVDRAGSALAGKLDKRQLGFGERAIVVALRIPEGDFRDWAEIKGWASEIADSLRSGAPPTWQEPVRHTSSRGVLPGPEEAK
jgi:menaquinone-dependent protoporphyrinogen oxidase